MTPGRSDNSILWGWMRLKTCRKQFLKKATHTKKKRRKKKGHEDSWQDTWRGRVGVVAGQPENIMDVGGQQAIAAVNVLVGVQVLVQPVGDGRHDLEGCLSQIDCTPAGKEMKDPAGSN